MFQYDIYFICKSLTRLLFMQTADFTDNFACRFPTLKVLQLKKRKMFCSWETGTEISNKNDVYSTTEILVPKKINLVLKAFAFWKIEPSFLDEWWSKCNSSCRKGQIKFKNFSFNFKVSFEKLKLAKF